MKPCRSCNSDSMDGSSPPSGPSFLKRSEGGAARHALATASQISSEIRRSRERKGGRAGYISLHYTFHFCNSFSPKRAVSVRCGAETGIIHGWPEFWPLCILKKILC